VAALRHKPDKRISFTTRFLHDHGDCSVFVEHGVFSAAKDIEALNRHFAGRYIVLGLHERDARLRIAGSKITQSQRRIIDLAIGHPTFIGGLTG